MKFSLIDAILEQSPERIVALKQVSLAEEYLADHFPSFPILPGVLMIETMVQAARAMLPPAPRLVLGEVRALKFGKLVRPGERLRVEITLQKRHEDGSYSCKGTGWVHSAGGGGGGEVPSEARSQNVAVTGRFTMRPIRHES